MLISVSLLLKKCFKQIFFVFYYFDGLKSLGRLGVFKVLNY